MAENKKTVVIYSDWESIFSQLSDDEAGKLIKHFFSYINDRNPQLDDRLLKIVFEPIKLQLKRDLNKWEETIDKRTKSGSLGGKKSGETRRLKAELKRLIQEKEANEASASNSKQIEANEAVNVNVNVNDTVIKNNKIKKDISVRKLEFKESLYPFVKTEKNPNGIYSADMVKRFYDYWTEDNKSGTKFKQETEKTWSLSGRLSRWASNNFDKKKNNEQSEKIVHIPANITIQHQNRPINND